MDNNLLRDDLAKIIRKFPVDMVKGVVHLTMTYKDEIAKHADDLKEIMMPHMMAAVSELMLGGFDKEGAERAFFEALGIVGAEYADKAAAGNLQNPGQADGVPTLRDDK